MARRAACLPVPSEARDLLQYCPTTGVLTWVAGQLAGSEAGTVRQDGYRRVKIGGVGIMAHRIAWFLHYGSDAPELIDHINGDKGDNRIANLRSATLAQNARNRNVHKGSRSGIKGVYPTPEGKWRAAIRKDGHLTSLGTFPNPERARAAYNKAAAVQHGQFARFS